MRSVSVLRTERQQQEETWGWSPCVGTYVVLRLYPGVIPSQEPHPPPHVSPPASPAAFLPPGGDEQGREPLIWSSIPVPAPLPFLQ